MQRPVEDSEAKSRDILLACSWLFQPGHVVEIRIPKAGKEKTISGYTDNVETLVKLALANDRKAAGVYFTLNQIDSALLSRAENCLKPWAQHTACDRDVKLLRNLLIDVDAVRASGISSTDAEHNAALDLARLIRQELMSDGWPEPLVQDSGNGAYLIFALPDLPNEDRFRDLIKACLTALARRFNTPSAVVDESTFNPSRIAKIPGTTARKGDSTETRPHRLSRVLDVPDVREPVALALLEHLAAQVPASSPNPATPRPANSGSSGRRNASDFNIDNWILKSGLSIKDTTTDKSGGRKWLLADCPFQPDDRAGNPFIAELPSGAIFFKCYHGDCSGQDWAALRRLIEPSYARSDPPRFVHTRKGMFFNDTKVFERICCNGRQLREVSADALAALQKVNDPPELFARTGMMVAVIRNEEQRQIISSVGVDALCDRLTWSADFFKVGKKDKNGNAQEFSCPPDAGAVKDILAMPPGLWKFPPLDAVVESPILRPDGTILETSGYDPETRLYYAPDPDLCIPKIAHCPLTADIERACALIKKAIGEFPYADAGGASYANTVAAMLTPIIRPAINAPAPMGLFDAPAPGTGKSLLCDLISIISTGQPAKMFSAPKDPDEWRKVITMALMGGGSVIVWDNVTRPLDNGDLASVLTATIWADRAMATHREITLPVRASFLANGNNIRLGGDLPRRCFRIRLDAESSTPYLRTGPKDDKPFEIQNLKRWAMDNRGELLAALLTLARQWFANGSPSPKVKPLGSFEAWTITVGGILENARIEGFLGNADIMRAESDDESGEWESFLPVLRTTFYDLEFTAAEVFETLNAKTFNPVTNIIEPTPRAASLKAVLPGALSFALVQPGSFPMRAGRIFGAQADRRFGARGIHLKRMSNAQGLSHWRVLPPEVVSA